MLFRDVSVLFICAIIYLFSPSEGRDYGQLTPGNGLDCKGVNNMWMYFFSALCLALIVVGALAWVNRAELFATTRLYLDRKDMNRMQKWLTRNAPTQDWRVR